MASGDSDIHVNDRPQSNDPVERRLRNIEQLSYTLKKLFEQTVVHQQQMLDRVTLALYGDGTEGNPGLHIRVDRLERDDRERSNFMNLVMAAGFTVLGAGITAVLIEVFVK